MKEFNTYVNRTLCDVLNEMRKACKTANYSYLPGLIEEAQSMGNRMEAALFDQKDIQSAHKYLKKLKKEIKELEGKRDEAAKRKGEG